MNIENYLKNLIAQLKKSREKQKRVLKGKTMNNRIRYAKNGNRLESVKTYNHKTNGARYRVLLEKDSGSWYIVDAEGGTVAAKGQEASFHKVKQAAKSALADLGIEFTPEARTKRVSHLHLVNGENVSPETLVETGNTSGEELG